MIVPSSALDTLKRARPEWSPWLSVIDEVVRESESQSWRRLVPGGLAARGERVPLLAGASISPETRGVRRLLQRLIRLASAGGTDAMSSLARVRVTDAGCLELFRCSIRHDPEPVRQIAAAHKADPEALQAVVALLPVPFLLACNERLAGSVQAAWSEGYCPLCGSWPAFAEIRGIERSRCYRCARCGGAWYARALVCPYCDMSDHNQLAALVPAKGDTRAVIDACNRCRGYIKAFTRLQGCPPPAVMIDDLASVDLDMAALDNGYARPPGAGHPVEVEVTGAGARGRVFGWRA
jgi:FdhE protein